MGGRKILATNYCTPPLFKGALKQNKNTLNKVENTNPIMDSPSSFFQFWDVIMCRGTFLGVYISLAVYTFSAGQLGGQGGNRNSKQHTLPSGHQSRITESRMLYISAHPIHDSHQSVVLIWTPWHSPTIKCICRANPFRALLLVSLS